MADLPDIIGVVNPPPSIVGSVNVGYGVGPKGETGATGSQGPAGTSGTVLTADQKAAIDGANTPSATNPMATMDDVIGGVAGVASVNGETGAVVVTPSSIGAIPEKIIYTLIPELGVIANVATPGYAISDEPTGLGSAWPATQAFDGVIAGISSLNFWNTADVDGGNNPGGFPHWIGQDFGAGNEQIVTELRIAPRSNDYYSRIAANTVPNVEAGWMLTSDATDSVGGDNGTITGNVTFPDGALFAGGNIDAAGINIPTGDVSFSAWIKTASNGTHSIIHYGVAGAGQINAHFLTIGGKLLFGPGYGGTTLSGNITISDNVWHHVVATYNTTTDVVNLYVDGILDNSGAVAHLNISAPAHVTIGSTLEPGAEFSGSIKEVFVYAKVLADYEVIELAIGRSIAAPYDFTLQGSNDNSNWDVIATYTNIRNWLPNVYKTFSVTNVTPYRYYRVHITDINDGAGNNGATGYCNISEIQMYAQSGSGVLGYDKDNPYIFGTNNEDILHISNATGDTFILLGHGSKEGDFDIVNITSNYSYISGVDGNMDIQAANPISAFDNRYGFLVEASAGSFIRFNMIDVSPPQRTVTLIKGGVWGNVRNVQWNGGSTDKGNGSESRNTLSDLQYQNSFGASATEYDLLTYLSGTWQPIKRMPIIQVDSFPYESNANFAGCVLQVYSSASTDVVYCGSIMQKGMPYYIVDMFGFGFTLDAINYQGNKINGVDTLAIPANAWVEVIEDGNHDAFIVNSNVASLIYTNATVPPTNSDIEVTDFNKGVILTSANGTRWRVQVDNDGALSTTELA